jgi:hypothetical protein
MIMKVLNVGFGMTSPILFGLKTVGYLKDEEYLTDPLKDRFEFDTDNQVTVTGYSNPDDLIADIRAKKVQGVITDSVVIAKEGDPTIPGSGDQYTYATHVVAAAQQAGIPVAVELTSPIYRDYTPPKGVPWFEFKNPAAFLKKLLPW